MSPHFPKGLTEHEDQDAGEKGCGAGAVKSTMIRKTHPQLLQPKTGRIGYMVLVCEGEGSGDFLCCRFVVDLIWDT